jgi:hypothetical protein
MVEIGFNQLREEKTIKIEDIKSLIEESLKNYKTTDSKLSFSKLSKCEGNVHI